MEEELFDAAYYGDVARVRRILENPDADANWGNYVGWTALHVACNEGHDEVVSLLLAHPRIDVNQKDGNGETPFLKGCANGSTACIRLLFKDHRVIPNQPRDDGYTPLFWAAFKGNLDVIRWWIVSGREMDLGEPGNETTDAIEGAREEDHAEVISLLERFRDHPEDTRHALRVELGWVDEMAAGVFALTVFLCDGLLECKAKAPKASARRTRFFQMIKVLPMEVQMVMCHRVAGSMGTNIPTVDSEVAFRSLAKAF